MLHNVAKGLYHLFRGSQYTGLHNIPTTCNKNTQLATQTHRTNIYLCVGCLSNFFDLRSPKQDHHGFRGAEVVSFMHSSKNKCLRSRRTFASKWGALLFDFWSATCVYGQNRHALCYV